MKLKELRLCPYPGRLFLAKSRKDFVKAHIAMFHEPPNVGPGTDGYSAWGCCNGRVVYLVWGTTRDVLIHELDHIELEVFKHVGIDPREANGEPFCYLKSQLLHDVGPKYGKH